MLYNKMLLFIYFFLNLYYVLSYNTFNIHIIKSSVLKFIPQIKAHHFVLIDDLTSDIFYTIDFTPETDLNNMDIIKLLFGKTVPAEIRLRKIKYKNLLNINDTDTIISVWHNINVWNKNYSKKLSELSFLSIENEEIKDYVQKILEWENTYKNIHLYFHNCQHFGKFCYEIFNQDKNSNL